MPKKKEVSKISNKIVYIFFLVGLVILLFLGFLYYQSKRPNYRDLEKAFNELTIPDGWKEVSSSSNQGTWGLFCWQIEGEECPYITKVYSRENVPDYNKLQSKLEEIKQSLFQLGYKSVASDQEYCSEKQVNQNDYICSIKLSKTGKSVYIAFRSSDANQVKGDFVTVSISRSD